MLEATDRIEQLAGRVNDIGGRLRNLVTSLHGPRPADERLLNKDPRPKPAGVAPQLHDAIGSLDSAINRLNQEVNSL